MGEPIRQQRRGKGSSTWRANSRNGKGDVEIKNAETAGTVVDIQHDPARTAPVAIVEYEDGEERAILAPETVQEGDEVHIGPSAPIEPGNTLPIGEIPEGVPIHSIETQPGDGGKLVRASGTYAFVVTHEKGGTRIRLPSKSFKKLNTQCRATIGKVAAGGRKDKPFVKAGNKHHAMKARGKKYPHVSAVAMNAVDHPFGGSAKPGMPKTVSRHASPGSKVGSVSARKTGNKTE
ncbi:50S ribosomal protein L2 [Candidatus Nanohalococcus occultus]|uniref:Large ribosomal subunit protein uL2 n=1 Tax=Candidatus Nanohalococcus occultus TaxID=2978047 RepID=A0ABY8CDB0_9ARCH|nr:Ribosomal protein L2 [Candidatus Nanohaloarchaeota archaeon SVXNc]